MPFRKTPLITGQTYHIFNRTIAKIPIFTEKSNCDRFMSLLEYYSFENTILRFSHYSRLPFEAKEKYLSDLRTKNEKLIDILGYVLMPNHFHLLLTEKQNHGISHYLQNVQNSFAKYFNLRKNRTGSLFQSMFKAVRIEDDDQLVHVLRYIHLNPLTSYILANIQDLEKYHYSSFRDYTNPREISITNIKEIMKHFKSIKKLKIYTFDQANYQRELNRIKHLMLEKP